MTEGEDYKEIIAEFIQGQMTIFGPTVAHDIAIRINGLVVDDYGKVKEFAGSPKEILQSLEQKYTELAGEVVHRNLLVILHDHPLVEVGYLNTRV